jgi:Spermidine/putrescine-binding periplasmic protein
MRRTFATLLFVGLGLLFLGSATAARAAEQLVVFMWAEYIDPEVVEDFEKKHDVKIKFDYYESNEEMQAKLQGGGLGQYDLIMPSTYVVPGLKHLGLIQGLDHGQLPNLKNIDSGFTTLEVDPGNAFTIPYAWGLSGLAVRVDEGAAAPEATWGLIFDPAKAVGNFTLLDNARDSLGAALKYLGHSLNSTEPAQIKEAAELLAASKKRPDFVGFYGGVGSMDKLVGGGADLVQAYSGETGRIGRESGQKISFVLPKEGGEIWTDLVAIPAKAPNPTAAHKFINYLLEPRVAAKLAVYNHCATPNAAAREFIDVEELRNPIINQGNLEYIKDLGPANRLYEEAWTTIKAR